MPETTVKDLPENLRQLAVQSRDALSRGNHGMVIDLAGRILSPYPGCLAIRRLQREAQLKQSPGGASAVQRTKGVVAQLGSLLRRKDTGEDSSAIAKADGVIAADPWSRKGWQQLAEATGEGGLPETAVFAWENLVAMVPADKTAGLGLVKAQLNLNRYPEALKSVESLLRHHPKDGAALALLRRASIDHTVEKGKWDSDASFRDKLRG